MFVKKDNRLAKRKRVNKGQVDEWTKWTSGQDACEKG